MKKLLAFIKLIEESPVLVKIMWVNSFVILLIVVGGMIFKFENTIAIIGLNAVQIIMFIKIKKQLDIKQKKINIEIDKLTEKAMKLFEIEIEDVEFDKKIKNLADFAMNNPFSSNELIEMHNGNSKPVGNIDGFFLWGPFHTKIVYCIENDGSKNIRYLSVSFMESRVRPPVEFVQTIMRLIGFKNLITNCTVGFQEVKGKENIVIVREIIEK